MLTSNYCSVVIDAGYDPLSSRLVQSPFGPVPMNQSTSYIVPPPFPNQPEIETRTVIGIWLERTDNHNLDIGPIFVNLNEVRTLEKLWILIKEQHFQEWHRATGGRLNPRRFELSIDWAQAGSSTLTLETSQNGTAHVAPTQTHAILVAAEDTTCEAHEMYYQRFVSLCDAEAEKLAQKITSAFEKKTYYEYGVKKVRDEFAGDQFKDLMPHEGVFFAEVHIEFWPSAAVAEAPPPARRLTVAELSAALNAESMRTPF